MDEKSLIRKHQTASQTSFDREGRKANVEDAFECVDGVLSDQKVLLIDDVCTTGATLNSCAAALREKGASDVWALTFAREV